MEPYPLSPTLAMALRFDERTRDVFSEFCRIILNYENYTGGVRDRNVPKTKRGGRRGMNRGPRKAGAPVGKGFGKSRTTNATGEVRKVTFTLGSFISPLGITHSLEKNATTLHGDTSALRPGIWMIRQVSYRVIHS